jgi:hypothetical protein
MVLIKLMLTLVILPLVNELLLFNYLCVLSEVSAVSVTHPAIGDPSEPVSLIKGFESFK